ncbi:MAG: ATP-dependent RNA helicase, partial [Planctomycetes bacterium]|nr:ATP-dependent RNA helicase [Planctomycetota bacterium]
MTERLLVRDGLELDISYPEALPVSGEREAICAALKRHPVLIVTGETGSGKTTQLPKMLLEVGHGSSGMIALTQPRRLSAIAMASRLRQETGSAEQSHIVHSIRFDDNAEKDTIVRVMTDGLLLREAARDPYLRAYDAIMIDEAHERSLNIDCLLGLLLRARKHRPELQIVITSASIDAQRFADFFADEVSSEFADEVIDEVHEEAPSEKSRKPAPIINVSGRLYPVAIEYRPPADNDVDYVSLMVETLKEVHGNSEPGDILCFLPSERDIMEIRRRLENLGGIHICPLFGRLTAHEQQHVFANSRKRKVILATNIAETSITVPGIRTVIDSGL